jgi:hypothetical protein
MSISNPFDRNPFYKQCFSLMSNATNCTLTEQVELYQHKKDNYYTLYRATYNNGNTPVRQSFIKFTDYLSYDLVNTNSLLLPLVQNPTCGQPNGTCNTLPKGFVSLFIITSFKDQILNADKFEVCCSTLTFVLSVANALNNALLYK